MLFVVACGAEKMLKGNAIAQKTMQRTPVTKFFDVNEDFLRLNTM